MPRTFSRVLLALCALLVICQPAQALGWPGTNDNLFPSAPADKSAIDFDGRGFLIHGQRAFIAAGDLHYSRVPRVLWRDRLLRIKRAGYNTIQTYTFWNYHEVHEGQYDFSGDKDLDAYLKLIHSLGMYAIVRVGPYVNAEWESGGWPVWLRFTPGVIVRENDPPFLNAMDRWLEHLMPIVASNQINHGGSVIMVQLENEDSRGAGTDLPNPYFQHLRDKCVALGLQVPYFFSGVNHSDHPAGDGPLDTSSRTSPWFSSEFWTGWINFYNTDPGRTLRLERATWQLLAYGGNGYSHYTMAGGTNFDGWNASEQGTNYDFGAPIGQAGDFRDVYYGLKRAAMFATSFPLILEDSQNATDAHIYDAPGVRVTARQSPDGTLLFLDNAGTAAVTTQVKGFAEPIHVQPGEIMPIVEGNYPICPGVKLARAARILTITTQGNVTTLVAYGPSGDASEVHFTVAQTPSEVTLKTTYPAQGIHMAAFRAGKQIVRVLTEDFDMADRTWLVTIDGKNALVCGPDYVGEATREHRCLVIDAERRSASLSPGPTDAYFVPGDAAPMQLDGMAPVIARAVIPTLGVWSTAPGDKEALPGYPDSPWRISADPQPMGADGDRSEYAWYRTTVQAPRAGDYLLNFSDAGDWLSVFVNGVHADSSSVQQRYQSSVPRSLRVTLAAGSNQITVLAAQYGRAKLHAYIGPLDTLDAKGISGPVTLALTGASSAAVQGWKMRGGISLPADNDPNWRLVSAASGNDGSPRFYRSQFLMPPLSPVGPRPILRVLPSGLSRGFFWLNGHNLGRYPEKATIDTLYLPPCWLVPGINTLMAFDEDGNSPTQLQIVEETIASHYALQLTPMKSKG